MAHPKSYQDLMQRAAALRQERMSRHQGKKGSISLVPLEKEPLSIQAAYAILMQLPAANKEIQTKDLDELKKLIHQFQIRMNDQMKNGIVSEKEQKQFTELMQQAEIFMKESKERLMNPLQHIELPPLPPTPEPPEKKSAPPKRAAPHEEGALKLLNKNLNDMKVKIHPTLPFQRKTTHDIRTDMLQALKHIRHSNNVDELFIRMKAISTIEQSQIQLEDKIKLMRQVVSDVTPKGKLGNDLESIHLKSFQGPDQEEKRHVQNFLTEYVTLLARHDLRNREDRGIKNQDNPVQQLLGAFDNNPQMKSTTVQKEADKIVQQKMNTLNQAPAPNPPEPEKQERSTPKIGGHR